MKGIAVWIWLIGGIIVGMIMFVLFFQLMSYLTLSRAREDARPSFDDLTSTVNALCEGRPGIQSSKKFVFPDSVSIVYSTSDPKTYVEKNNRTYGKFACLKFQKEQFCEGVSCDLEFHPIKAEENLLGVVDTLLGRSSYQEYLVKLTKTECGVSALNVGENPSSTCGLCKTVSLIRCQTSVILGLVSRDVLVITDMSRLKECCTIDNSIIKLLNNAAGYLGGKKILIVWELNQYDPSSQSKLPIINSLSSSGFMVGFLRHTTQLTDDILKNYDQLWLFRPGWCLPQIVECGWSVTWSNSEINAIGNFQNRGGKIFLFTDTSAGNVQDQDMVNKILKQLNTTATVDGTTVCGRGDQTVMTTDITKNSVTKGLDNFNVTAATRIIC